MRKTGVFGGTFDPIHYGHLKIAETAYKSLGLDRVLVIPSGFSYFKADRQIPEGRIRYEMCRLACRDFGFFEVSDIEVRRKGNSYTFQTLKELREMFPEDEFFYILGADSLAQIRDFKNPEMIFSHTKVAVSLRDGHDKSSVNDMIMYYEKAFNADISVFNTENINISSSLIRQRVKEGLDINGLVPEVLGRYIKENGLYR